MKPTDLTQTPRFTEGEHIKVRDVEFVVDEIHEHEMVLLLWVPTWEAVPDSISVRLINQAKRYRAEENHLAASPDEAPPLRATSATMATIGPCPNCEAEKVEGVGI